MDLRVETYQEMIMLRRKIKSQREQAIYRQRKRKQFLLDGIFIFIGVLVGGGIIYVTAEFIRERHEEVIDFCVFVGWVHFNNDPVL